MVQIDPIIRISLVVDAAKAKANGFNETEREAKLIFKIPFVLTYLLQEIHM